MTVKSITASANTRRIVLLCSGTVSYVPEANYNGAASFDYQVCDNGTTNGSPDSKCATGAVMVTITDVNDSPRSEERSEGKNGKTTRKTSARKLKSKDRAGTTN